MKNVLTVIINPAASPAMTGILPPKHVLRNVQVLINTLVPAPVIPAEAARLAVENTRSVLAPADMLGTENLVLPKMLV